jgi:hypothetical protein
MFLERESFAEEQELFWKITNHKFILKLEYLTGCVTENNQLNLSLQRNMENIFTAQDKVASVLSQFQLHRQVK